MLIIRMSPPKGGPVVVHYVYIRNGGMSIHARIYCAGRHCVLCLCALPFTGQKYPKVSCLGRYDVAFLCSKTTSGYIVAYEQSLGSVL